MDVASKTEEFGTKLRGYIKGTEDWKISKRCEKSGVTVWWKPSTEFEGKLFKGECIINASPEKCFSFCDPKPDGHRPKWDNTIHSLEIVEQIQQENPEAFILRTMTHGAAMGLISARDFVDLIINVKDDDWVAVLARSIETDKCPPDETKFVRGINHYCGIMAQRLPGEPDKARVHYIAQADISGMIPQSLVDAAVPSAIVEFYNNLKRQVEP